MKTPDPDIVEKLLALLRQWGWETGYKRLEAELGPAGISAAAAGSPEVNAFFLSWMAIEKGDYAHAEQHLKDMEAAPRLAAWAMFARAFSAFRRWNYDEALRLLNDAEKRAGRDSILNGAIAHIRGSVHYHRGDSETAMALLKEAYKAFAKPVHFALGRVLDTMGMVYAATSNFHAAREFYRRSLHVKQAHGDTSGLAVSHGQLGRLYLDWGIWDLARAHFVQNLELCERIDDRRGKALMSNSLGQVALAEANQGDAASWLDSAIQLSLGRDGWEVLEGFARKDRALVLLAEGGDGELAAAREQLQRADGLFHSIRPPFVEGLAHVSRAWGIWHRARREWEDSFDRLRDAAKHFQDHGEPVELARTQLEVIRTRRAAGETGAPLTLAVAQALAAAEKCRRVYLVRQIEQELRAAGIEAYYRHIIQRVRGRGAQGDTADLMGGTRETATVLFLDIKDSTVFAREHDPAQVMLTLNPMDELAAVLRTHDARVEAFRGDGFLAVIRGVDHPLRAVTAALDLNQSIKPFNEPRELLGLPLFAARIGINTGEVFLGNVGTYDKVDFTAIGRTTSLGARLEQAATPGEPLIGQATRELVGDRFEYRDPGGRMVPAKNFDPDQVRAWDVVGIKKSRHGAGAPGRRTKPPGVRQPPRPH